MPTTHCNYENRQIGELREVRRCQAFNDLLRNKPTEDIYVDLQDEGVRASSLHLSRHAHLTQSQDIDTVIGMMNMV